MAMNTVHAIAVANLLRPVSPLRPLAAGKESFSSVSLASNCNTNQLLRIRPPSAFWRPRIPPMQKWSIIRVLCLHYGKEATKSKVPGVIRGLCI